MNNTKKTTSSKDKTLRVLLYLAVLVLVLITLYPYFAMFTTALKARSEIYAKNGTVLPIIWHWENFVDIWKLAPLSRYFANSLLISGGATAIAILCGIPAAYALSRMKFKGKKFFLGLVIVSQMFSPVVLLVGIYKIMSMLHLTDTLMALIFINAAFNQAFAIWLLRGTFMSISSEMEQAATIDGCNRVQAMLRVLLPVAAPGIVTALIFVFINAWNEYTVALTLISTDVLKPLTVGITTFNGYNMIEWQYLFSSSLFATLPVVILFICIEKHLVGGLTSGGVKG
ncbi:MAG: carbohydrate ABC transporter permease [Eubacteriales bacterium]|nr:carbohydrate ABC transporter permease [Eubacteriales bacterium]